MFSEPRENGGPQTTTRRIGDWTCGRVETRKRGSAEAKWKAGKERGDAREKGRERMETQGKRK